MFVLRAVAKSTGTTTVIELLQNGGKFSSAASKNFYQRSKQHLSLLVWQTLAFICFFSHCIKPLPVSILWFVALTSRRWSIFTQ